MTDHSLLVSFPDQSHSFVHGFEAGAVWHRLHAGEAFEITGHAANASLYDQIAKHFKAKLEIAETGLIEWNYYRFNLGGTGRGKKLHADHNIEARVQ